MKKEEFRKCKYDLTDQGKHYSDPMYFHKWVTHFDSKGNEVLFGLIEYPNDDPCFVNRGKLITKAFYYIKFID